MNKAKLNCDALYLKTKEEFLETIEKRNLSSAETIELVFNYLICIVELIKNKGSVSLCVFMKCHTGGGPGDCIANFFNWIRTVDHPDPEKVKQSKKDAIWVLEQLIVKQTGRRFPDENPNVEDQEKA